MLETMSIWETIALGGLMLLILFWVGPGIKGALQQSQQAEKDWPAVLVPLAVVLLFVVFLVVMT